MLPFPRKNCHFAINNGIFWPNLSNFDWFTFFRFDFVMWNHSYMEKAKFTFWCQISWIFIWWDQIFNWFSFAQSMSICSIISEWRKYLLACASQVGIWRSRGVLSNIEIMKIVIFNVNGINNSLGRGSEGCHLTTILKRILSLDCL